MVKMGAVNEKTTKSQRGSISMATNVIRMTAAMVKQQNQARAQIFHSLFTPSHQVIGGSEKVQMITEFIRSIFDKSLLSI